MKKLMGVSLLAMLVIRPLTANAAVGDVVSVNDPVHADPATVASTAPGYALATEGEHDGNVATAGYVKGAYNAAMKAINKVADTAVQSVAAGTANGTISVDGGADITVYDDTTLSGRVTANENKIGSTTLTTTAQTLTGAIEEVKGTAGFAGTASELTDTNFQSTDKTSAAKAANAAMAAAAAAQADADTANTAIGTIGDLETTATDLVEAINEVKTTADAALTSSDLATYATQAGVENTIETVTITATVPTLTAWGNDSSTGTVGVTVSNIAATYAEPSNP